MTDVEYEELCIKKERYEKLMQQYNNILELINYKRNHNIVKKDNDDCDIYAKIIIAKYGGTEAKEYIINNNKEMYNDLQQVLIRQRSRIVCEIEKL